MKIQFAASAALVCCSILPACAKAPTKTASKSQSQTQAARDKARIAQLEVELARSRKQVAALAKQLLQVEQQLAAKEVKKMAAMPKKEIPQVLNFSMKSLDGRTVKLEEFAGKTILIVNTASKCGFTKQYEGLQKLYEKHKDQNFVILGFPSGDFGGQELAEDADIALFCKANYGVSFPMFSKVSVKGDSKVPLFKYLTDEATNPASPGEIGWNFEKFLIDPSGKVVARWKSSVTPESQEIEAAIDKARGA